jgi:hypothetical protein
MRAMEHCGSDTGAPCYGAGSGVARCTSDDDGQCGSGSHGQVTAMPVRVWHHCGRGAGTRAMPMGMRKRWRFRCVRRQWCGCALRQRQQQEYRSALRRLRRRSTAITKSTRGRCATRGARMLPCRCALLRGCPGAIATALRDAGAQRLTERAILGTRACSILVQLGAWGVVVFSFADAVVV